jgi:hypothetical protein
VRARPFVSRSATPWDPFQPAVFGTEKSDRKTTCHQFIADLPDDVFDREGQELEALGLSQPSFVSSVQVRAGIPFHCL